MGRELFSFYFLPSLFGELMEDTFFTGRALSKNLQEVIFFLALRRTYKTSAFSFKMATLFSNILDVLIQERLGVRFGLNEELKCRR